MKTLEAWNEMNFDFIGKKQGEWDLIPSICLLTNTTSVYRFGIVIRWLGFSITWTHQECK
jgi:hypothetical protein